MTDDASGSDEVVVTSRRIVGLTDALAVLAPSLLGSGYVASGGARVVAGMGIAAAFLALMWLLRGFATHAVVVTPTALELRRRFGSVILPRESIHRVRGSNAERPEWSWRVFVDTDDGRVEIPTFWRPPVTEVMTQLQVWHAETAVERQAAE